MNKTNSSLEHKFFKPIEVMMGKKTTKDYFLPGQWIKNVNNYFLDKKCNEQILDKIVYKSVAVLSEIERVDLYALGTTGVGYIIFELLDKIIK